MKVLLDENIPPVLGAVLAEAGFEVRAVADIAPGTSDPEVLANAAAVGEVLVTADKDFGALVFHRGQSFHGVVLIRAHPIADHVDRVVQAMTERKGELADAFVVLDARRTRVRRRR